MAAIGWIALIEGSLVWIMGNEREGSAADQGGDPEHDAQEDPGPGDEDTPIVA